MKNFKSLLIVVLLALGFAACEKDPVTKEKAPIIKVDATEIELSSHGESIEIGYTIENARTAQQIEVENLAEWLLVEVSENTITFSADKNATANGRIINVVVKYEGADNVEITVKQPNIDVPRENLSLEVVITEVGPTSIKFDIEASHPDMTWIPMVTYKEYWDDPPSTRQ